MPRAGGEEGALLRALLLCVVGIVPAFFLVFNTLFSDSGGLGDLVMALGLTFLGYLLVAVVVGLLWPRERFSNAVWLLLPAVIIALLYATQEPQIIPFGLAELAAALVGTLVGAVVGASLRSRSRGDRSSRPTR